jgi:phage terminase large subunit-like protein
MGMERKLAAGSLIHGGHPLMGWAISNARVETKRNSSSITWAVAGRAEIDPLVAGLNAATLMALNPEPLRDWRYQTSFVG